MSRRLGKALTSPFRSPHGGKSKQAPDIITEHTYASERNSEEVSQEQDTMDEEPAEASSSSSQTGHLCRQCRDLNITASKFRPNPSDDDPLLHGILGHDFDPAT